MQSNTNDSSFDGYSSNSKVTARLTYIVPPSMSMLELILEETMGQRVGNKGIDQSMAKGRKADSLLEAVNEYTNEEAYIEFSNPLGSRR